MLKYINDTNVYIKGGIDFLFMFGRFLPYFAKPCIYSAFGAGIYLFGKGIDLKSL